MDRKLPENPEIQRLIRLSQASRSFLGNEAIALRHKLDVPARLKDSLKSHPSSWLFGSLASGLAASLIFRRRPAVDKKRKGIPATLLGLTLTAARPLAKVWLTDQLKHWITTSSPPPASRPNSKPF
jgi:hypothetical protein